MWIYCFNITSLLNTQISNKKLKVIFKLIYIYQMYKELFSNVMFIQHCVVTCIFCMPASIVIVLVSGL